MKKIFSLILLVITTITYACSNSDNQQKRTLVQVTEIVKNVNVDEFAELINKGEAQVLDVRTPEEWSSGTIKDAKKMNFFEKGFNDQLDKLDKTKIVLVYCKSGGRSGKAAKELGKKGFKVYNLKGGITAWKDASKPTVK